MAKGKFKDKRRRKEERVKKNLIEKKEALKQKVIMDLNSKEDMSLIDEILTDNTYLVWITFFVSLLVNMLIYGLFHLVQSHSFENKNYSTYTSFFYFYGILILGTFIYSLKIKEEKIFNYEKMISFLENVSYVFLLLAIAIFFSFGADSLYLKNIFINYLFILYIVLSTIIINKTRKHVMVFFIPIILTVIYMVLYGKIAVKFFENFPVFSFFVVSSFIYLVYLGFKDRVNTNRIVKELKISNERLPPNNNWLKSSRVISMLAILIAFLNTYFFILLICLYGPKYFTYICCNIVKMDKRTKARAICDLALNVIIVIFVYIMANIKINGYNIFNSFYRYILNLT